MLEKLLPNFHGLLKVLISILLNVQDELDIFHYQLVRQNFLLFIEKQLKIDDSIYNRLVIKLPHHVEAVKNSKGYSQNIKNINKHYKYVASK